MSIQKRSLVTVDIVLILLSLEAPVEEEGTTKTTSPAWRTPINFRLLLPLMPLRTRPLRRRSTFSMYPHKEQRDEVAEYGQTDEGEVENIVHPYPHMIAARRLLVVPDVVLTVIRYMAIV